MSHFEFPSLNGCLVMSEEGSIEASLTKLHNGYLYLEKEHLIGQTPADPLRLGEENRLMDLGAPDKLQENPKKKNLW